VYFYSVNTNFTRVPEHSKSSISIIRPQNHKGLQLEKSNPCPASFLETNPEAFGTEEKF